MFILLGERKKKRKMEKDGAGEMIQEALEAISEQASEHCIKPMFIS